jgi:hypothetical protein
LDAFNSGTINIDTKIFTNNGSIEATNGSNITIDSQLLGGTGMTFISDATVTMEGGAVGSGQTVDVGTGGASNGNLVIDDPKDFFGTVDMQGGGFVDLVGLGFGVTTSYSYSNNVLTLFNNNGQPVDRLNLKNETPFGVWAVYNPTGSVPVGSGGLPSGEWLISSSLNGTNPVLPT